MGERCCIKETGFQDQVRNSKYIIVCMCVYVQYVCCVCVHQVCWTTEMYLVGCCLATKVFLANWQLPEGCG